MNSTEKSSASKEKLLKSLYWDYEVDASRLVDIISGNIPDTDSQFSRERIFVRMLERLNWLDIISILSKEQIAVLLTPAAVSSIRFNDLRERYEFIRKVLSGETVSFTGWGDEYYQKIKHTLLSNRWYRAQQTLL